ncbi:hypothetical protein [Rhizorhabdus histidinilytica]|uniref:hypothetical protein n=1 Tax=Rhizorhabdus histidinilytica TaxID=439228 RepID=UPI00321F8455
MAQTVLTLKCECRPALDALIACAREIAETHGEDRAMAWASAALEADFDLFWRVVSDTRPALRLVQGGR